MKILLLQLASALLYSAAGFCVFVMFLNRAFLLMPDSQTKIPIILGSIVIPSIYGRRFDHGHFVIKGTHLFIASGVGAANPPVRIYCQPDIFIVDILPGKKGIIIANGGTRHDL